MSVHKLYTCSSSASLPCSPHPWTPIRFRAKKKRLKGLKDYYQIAKATITRKPRPESGPKCRICAILTRQRVRVPLPSVENFITFEMHFQI